MLLSTPILIGVPVATWQVMNRANRFTGRAEATVISVRRQEARQAVSCPTVVWNVEGTEYTAELSCERASQARTVGQSLPIRFDPEQPSRAAPDSWWALYGLLFPTAIGGLLAAGLIVVVIRRKPPHGA